MIDYAAILTLNFSDRQWSITGEGYDAIVWHDDAGAIPQKQLDGLWGKTQADLRNMAADRARRAAYAEVSDPLFFKWQRGEVSKQEWLDSVAAVKAAHPKV